MKRGIIYLHGSFIGDNFGDMLLLRLFAQWVRQYRKDCEPIVINASDYASRECHIKKESMPKAMASGDPIVFCGGGYFGENALGGRLKSTYWHMRLWKRHLVTALGARCFNRPYCILGVELGPLTSRWSRNTVLAFMRDADCCLLRNSESMNYAIDNGVPPNSVELTADAILSLKKEELVKLFDVTPEDSIVIEEVAQLEGPVIGLHLPAGNSHRRRKIVQYIENDFVAPGDGSVVLLSDSEVGYMERDFFGWLPEGRYSNVRHIAYRTPGVLIGVLEKCHTIITSQLHVGICGAIMSKRIWSVPSHSKTQRFYSSIGRPDICSMVERQKDEDIVDKCRAVISGEHVVVRVPEEIRARASLNRERLGQFIEKQTPESGSRT